MNYALTPSITRTRAPARFPARFPAQVAAVDVLFVVDVDVLSFRKVFNGRNGIAWDERGAR